MTDDIYQRLTVLVKQWGKDLGFQEVGITDTRLDEHESHLDRWLESGYHGDMHYMAAHGTKRSRPAELVAGTKRVICVRLNYLKDTQTKSIITSDNSDDYPITTAETADDTATEKMSGPGNRDKKGYVARYALGRDYHKVIRKRLLRLWQRMEEYLAAADLTHHSARVFTDSAPILEKALAEKAGLGWIGKNTLLLNKNAGSWFFLGEMFTDIPLMVDEPTVSSHCGSCTSCMDVCPTNAFVAPYRLDATQCISYLTIEYRGSIPLELRKPIGNRIFGCDDCQVFCPWNKFASFSEEADFSPRHNLDNPALLVLFGWSEQEFLKNTEGSAIRRTGYEGWLRNIAVALGNASYDPEVIQALTLKKETASELVKEHISWAIEQQASRQ